MDHQNISIPADKLKKLMRWASLAATFRRGLLRRPAVPPPQLVSHSQWADYLVYNFNKTGLRILEVGSRNVTGMNVGARFNKANYIGFDLYPGENVDIVGDAHRLSTHFEAEEFDLVFSSAVFEHFAMPWLVVEEIAKVLKIGGYAFVETHFSFAAHERPWNFFQFSDMGLRSLFNSALGFAVLDSGMSNPMAAWFGRHADPYLRFGEISELYCHNEILCKKTRSVADFDWRAANLSTIVGGTMYPPPSGASA